MFVGGVSAAAAMPANVCSTLMRLNSARSSMPLAFVPIVFINHPLADPSSSGRHDTRHRSIGHQLPHHLGCCWNLAFDFDSIRHDAP
jgi:hypothetical protein